LIFLQEQNDLGSSGESLSIIVDDGESASSIGLPSVLLVIVGFGDDLDSVSDQI